MPSEEESYLPDDFVPSSEAETRRFAPDEMVACEKCRRANPPTRMSCIYCGEPLPVTKTTETRRRPTLRPLEEWEQGINVVLLPVAAQPSEETFEEASALLRIETGLLVELVSACDALPVARAASDEEAALIVERLSALGLDAVTVADAALAVDSSPPARVRRLEFADEHLTAWMAGGQTESARWDELALLVTGRITSKRVEVEERRGRMRPGGEVADARELFTDESALEIYTEAGAAGWRIMSGNFDYTCLGERKGLLSVENFRRLVEELRRRAPRAVFDGGYDRRRQMLGAAWPPAEHKETGGLRRERPGKFNAEAVTVVTNETQFTRYARLRHRLGLRQRDAENR